MGLRENYEKLMKKYNLPKFEELEKHFDLEEINDDVSQEKILYNIRKKICEKIDLITDFLSSIIYFESETYAVFESGNLTKEEKNQLFKIFKSLMFIKRSALKIVIETNEEMEAEFIRESFQRFLSVKEELLKIIDKIRSFWIKDENEEKRVEYFG
ncbi:MAG: hypothetical protein QXU20_02365 [Candidatus Woesearchaeota archaeon]